MFLRWATAHRLLADARADAERALAVLREENSTWRRMLEAAQRQNDHLTTELIRSLAISPAVAGPKPPPFVRPPTSRDPIAGLGNMLDPVPLGHPEGEFTDARAASLMQAEDDGVSHAA